MSEKKATMKAWQENCLSVCAKGMAAAFSMDADDIKEAYKDKPDSLTAHFDTVAQAKENQIWYAGWGILWAVVALPVALYPAYRLWQIRNTLGSIEKTVRGKVENTQRAQDGPSQDGPQP